MYLIPAGILLLIFSYLLYSKIRTRHTVGLHRDPSNVRRSHREKPLKKIEENEKVLVL